MADAQLYSAQDIEKLKQKIATYRDTLTTLKSGNTIDDYLFMKSELTGFKMQVSHLEEVMERLNDKRSTQLEEYEQQIDTFAQQIGSLNKTVEELNKDFSVVMNQLTNDRKEKVNTSSDMQDPVNSHHNTDVLEATEASRQLEGKTSISSIQQSNRPPSYKYLQSLVAGANDIQDASSTVTPTVSKHQVHVKQSFPAIGNQPNQIYNGLNRNLNREPMIHFNNATTKKAMPTNGVNLVPAISQPILEVEKNEEAEVASEEVFYKVALEEIAPHIEEFEREISPEASIEITSEMKRQQHKNKEASSLFNFFRRKS
ncbi:hypothetical protein [Sporosarcina beigongshangi]|uniref:hypothetical protein n=1 Tax=Sporosarcina beigongshangi TaxID=2782538 RepID=UPI0019398E40|nr:hypothetical protein [Sporosarcina beigongshangi]